MNATNTKSLKVEPKVRDQAQFYTNVIFTIWDSLTMSWAGDDYLQ